MRIVAEFAGRGDLTVASLRTLLPEVPPATLYRHIALLADGGVLSVAETRAKRGATEKTYRLAVQPLFTLDDLAKKPERFLEIITMAAASLIRDFSRYFARVDLPRRTVDPLIRSYAVLATDEEFARLRDQLDQLTREASRAGATSPAGRSRRIFYIAAIPDMEGPA